MSLSVLIGLHRPNVVSFQDNHPRKAVSLYKLRADSFARIKAQRAADRAKREARYLALRDSFAQLKQLRLLQRAEREALYLARRDSFARLKIEREAAKAKREAAYIRYKDSLRLLIPEKLSEGEFIYLNQADTSLLAKVPGIGRGLARAIVFYRQQLGGFACKEQVLEVHGVTTLSLPYLRIQGKPNQLPVNHLSVAQMRRHPYLNFYQAKAIYEYRRKFGPIHALTQLSLLKEFGEADFTRLTPYLSFD